MTLAPKRRWIRYSLLTLLVVVAVAAAWIGYHLDWIKKRHDALIWIDAHRFTGSFGGFQNERRPDISWSLWALGEKAAEYQFFLGPGYAAGGDLETYRHRVQEIIRLFPESQIFDCKEGFYPDQL